MEYQGRLRQLLQYMGAEAASRDSTAEEGGTKVLPGKTRTKTHAQAKKRPCTRVFKAGRMGERGSALVYAAVLFGVLAIILSSAVSQEGSAQALNIRTGQRRKALDLARGVVDEMLSALSKNGFDLSKCPPITQGVEAEKWSATATASKDSYGCIWVVGEATVVGISETVKVKLEPYSLLDLYSDGVVVAGDDVEVDLKNNANGLEVYGNVYVGDKWSCEGNDSKVYVDGKVYEGYPVEIPKPQDVTKQAKALIDAKENQGSWWELGQKENIVIEHDTKAKNLSISGNGSLVVKQDTWLYVDGNFVANGNPTITADGVLAVGGDINLGTSKDVSISGSGIIICLSEKKESKITLGLGNWGGMSIVCAGGLELDFVGTPELENPSLFVYARELELGFKTETPFELDPCRFISSEKTTIHCKHAELVKLHAGDFDSQGHGSLLGGSYRIESWSEGKAR